MLLTTDSLRACDLESVVRTDARWRPLRRSAVSPVTPLARLDTAERSRIYGHFSESPMRPRGRHLQDPAEKPLPSRWVGDLLARYLCKLSEFGRLGGRWRHDVVDLYARNNQGIRD